MTNEPTSSKTNASEHLQRAFGRNLQQLRKKQGMTQEGFAEKAGLSVDMVSGMERGVRFASFDTLAKIATIMDCPLEDIFNFDPNAKPRPQKVLNQIQILLKNEPQSVQEAALAQLRILVDTVRRKG